MLNNLFIIVTLIFSLESLAKKSLPHTKITSQDDSYQADVNADGELLIDGEKIRTDLNSQSDETQLILQSEFDELQNINQTEFDAFQSLFLSEINESQVNQDEQLSETQGFRSDYNSQTDETQVNQDEQLSETQGFRSDFNGQLDESQLKLDSIEDNQTNGSQESIVYGPDNNGAIATKPPVRTGGTDYGSGGAIRAFSVDINGRIEAGLFSLSGNRVVIDSDGNMQIELRNNSSSIDYNFGTPTSNTIRTASSISDKDGNPYEFLASASTVALPVQLVGNDGLYRAFVDADGKVSTNANVTFPEVFQYKKPILNGSNRSMDVDGSGASVEFSISPPSGTIFFVQGMSISLADSGTFDLGDLGAIGGGTVSNGLQCSVVSKGITKEIFNIFNNMDMYSVFSDSSIPNTISGGLFGSDENIFSGNYIFTNRIALDGNFSDKIYCTVRDNLGGLDELYIYVNYWELNG